MIIPYNNGGLLYHYLKGLFLNSLSTQDNPSFNMSYLSSSAKLSTGLKDDLLVYALLKWKTVFTLEYTCVRCDTPKSSELIITIDYSQSRPSEYHCCNDD